MSTATAFKYQSAFPFCAADMSSATYDVVAGLTLTQLMDFFWNVEDVQITTAGSSTGFAPHTHTASCAGSFKHDPPTATGDYTSITAWAYNISSSLVPADAGPAISDLPVATTNPVDRVCRSSAGLMNVSASGSSAYLTSDFNVQLFASIDPSDATKYAIAYRFFIPAGDFYGAVVAFSNPAYGAQSTSGSYTTGTFSINGLTFNWRCYYNDNFSGASMSASMTKFTY